MPSLKKMQHDYQTRNSLTNEYLKSLNLHLPEWARELVELYQSPLKYKINYELREIQKHDLPTRDPITRCP
jgi:hypothetical protein